MDQTPLFPILILILLLTIPLLLVFLNRLRLDLAALIMAVGLGLSQLLGLGMLGPANTPSDAVKAISGFSQPVVLTLISLFIMTQVLDRSGVTRWIAFRLVRLGGNNTTILIGAFATTTALLSLIMNNLAAAAMLLPAAMEVSRQTGVKPSKLLIPISFGSLLGGMATYFTTANIILNDMLLIAEPPQQGLGILNFTPTGGLIAVAGILFLVIFGNKLLPNREPSAEQAFTRLTGSQLEDYYEIGERLWEGQVRKDSGFVNRSISECGFGNKWGVVVAAVCRPGEEFTLPMPLQILHAGDTVLLVGREEKVLTLQEMGLKVQLASSEDHLTFRGISVAEVVLGPHAHVQGKTLKEIDFRQKYGLTVVALRRLNRSYRTDVGAFELVFGDSLLVIGGLNQIQNLKKNRDFIVLEPNPADMPIQKKVAGLASAILIAAIVASILGVPVFLSMLMGAVLMLILNLITMEEAYRAIEWQPIFLIAGMYSISLAMIQTGAASLMGNALLRLVQPLGGLGLVAGSNIFASFLTQFIGGQVSALIAGPVTISAAISMGVNAQAIAVATAIGCSISFLTPIAHPVNILIIGPGNYKFSDFFKIGWILSVISFLMLIIAMILFWGL
ncbi:MAG: SLC13 family permease [Anaerolineaceae bacterium]